MNVYEAAIHRRTIRKFKQVPIEDDILERLVNAARLAPSASNLQPLKYAIVTDKDTLGRIFDNVKWAGYIAPEGNPKEGEEPAAYIIILVDTEIRKEGYELDAGAAAQSIQLAAWEEGIGACWMGAIDRNAIRSELGIPEKYIINTVIAMGYPAETPVYEDENGSIRYYKDGVGTLHVPKRKLKDVIVRSKE
jgi:nitroreductase